MARRAMSRSTSRASGPERPGGPVGPAGGPAGRGRRTIDAPATETNPTVPTLACRICGRVLDAAAMQLAEGRCPRCGAILASERRGENRRKVGRDDRPSRAGD